MSQRRWWFGLGKRPRVPFKLLFARFRQLIDSNTRVLQIFADAVEKQSGEYVFDRTYVTAVISQLFELADKIVYDLNSITDQQYADLYAVVDQLRAEALGDLAGQPVVPRTELCVPLAQIDESRVNLVGGKSAHLGEVATRLQVDIPAGFTISTHAYLRVVEENELGPVMEAALGRLARGDPHGCEAVRQRLRQAKIPKDVRRAIAEAVRGLEKRGQPLYLAIRSSALGEDEDLSFAGQYHSVLQVKPDGVLDAYREVLASLYSPGALAYRQTTGYPGFGLMAVIAMRMVNASVAGVLHTVDPNQPDSLQMLLTVTRGLAGRAVDGQQSLSCCRVSREAPYEVVSYQRATAAEKLVGRAEGGTALVPVTPAEQETPELSAADAAKLAEIALRIERYFKQPQEIEWARDINGTLYVIQSRRLKLTTAPCLESDLPELLERYPVLVRGCGHVACRGVAHGRVHVLASDEGLDAVSAGAILVARRASPRYVGVMAKVAAILTDIGAPTGHMAALAREFRVPTIVDCGDITTRLSSGQEVTVDADDGVIYAGRVAELLHHQLVEETGYEDAPEYRLLRRLLRRITPLGLTDPQSDDFHVERCRTVHDIIRFAHEKAVEGLIARSVDADASGSEMARRLDAELPLNLQVIDIGGGLDVSVLTLPAKMPVKPEVIRSAPMRSVWAGLTTPGVWNTQPVGVDLHTFIASAMSPTLARNRGRNLAVVSDSYVNLSLNLGYHFNMVDAYVSEDREANHVYFRFVGGASDRERRIRRARVVREILERLNFEVRQTADLVIARLGKLPRVETEGRLEAIGRLIGFTRQIDALLDSEETAMNYVDAFLRGDYNLQQ